MSLLIAIHWCILLLHNLISFFKGGTSSGYIAYALYFASKSQDAEKTNYIYVFFDNFLGLFFPSHNFFRSMNNIELSLFFESQCKGMAKSLRPDSENSIKNYCEEKIRSFDEARKFSAKRKDKSSLVCCRTNASEY